jgi:predicted permease
LNGYQDGRVRAIYAETISRLRAAPGVEGATYTSHTLIANSSAIGVARRTDESAPSPGSAPARAFIDEHLAWRLGIEPGYFATLGIPILRGRGFTGSDTAVSEGVAVVNRLLAARLFRSEDVVGRRLRLGLRADAPVYEIVGVVSNTRYTGVRTLMPPTVYLPALQQPAGPATFEVRTVGDPDAFAATARAIVAQVDANLPVFAMRSQADQIAAHLNQEKLFARLALLLAIVALTLSAIGLYGLLSYAVTQRTPEIGVRMALGAARTSVQWLVLRQSLTLTAVGLVLGMAGAVAGTRVVNALLYETPARDPLSLGTAAVVMLVVSIAAGYMPARRASRVDPIVALRAD